MRKRLVVGLIVLNALLALGVWATPAMTQLLPAGLFDCCQGSGEEAYCCEDCCWFVRDCRDSGDCQLN